MKGEFRMNYEELAHKIIRKMIERPAKGGHFRADDLPHGGKKVLLSLFLISDGVTAGELSDKMGVSTARIASILKGWKRQVSCGGKPIHGTAARGCFSDAERQGGRAGTLSNDYTLRLRAFPPSGRAGHHGTSAARRPGRVHFPGTAPRPRPGSTLPTFMHRKGLTP